MKSVHLVIAGRVQRVGYRDWMVREARGLGLAGWVRNRADGTVEAVAAGPAEIVDRLVAACRRGPRLAEVSTVIVRDTEAPETEGFHRLESA
jgi:acylphosphatase